MKKNVLVIMCDQLRKDCLGCYGNEFVKTPNIDALAKNSVVCDKNYVANPICMPNRMSLFTGMYPRNHGLWTNGLYVKDDGHNLMYYLKENGYQTANLGKIHFEPNICNAFAGSKEADSWWEQYPNADEFTGPYRGFDYIQLSNNHHGYSGHMKKWFFENGGKDEMFKPTLSPGDIQTGTENVPTSLTSSAFVKDKTVEYLEKIRNPRKPFFAVASFPDPHHPFISPKECYDKWEGKPYKKPIGTKDDLTNRPERYMQHFKGAWSRAGIGAEKTPNGLSETLKEERILNTYAMIEHIDDCVGDIIKSLESENLLKDTIIIFTSDHGELLGDFGLWLKGPFFFEGLVNTPLMISAPNTDAKNCKELISAVDFAPTICGLLNLEVPFYMDGINQCDVLFNDAKNKREHCMIEYRNGYVKKDINYKVIIDKNYKYIRDEFAQEELVDLIEDENELNNLAQNENYKQKCDYYAMKLLNEMLKTECKKPLQNGHA